MRVTDRNPEYDPADIRGSASPDPESRGNGRERVLESCRYPSEPEDAIRTCATCGKSIPRNERQCPFCAHTSVSETPADDQDDSPLGEWTFGRVVLALVEANTDFHARALGAAAFSVSDSIASGGDTSHGTVKCRAAFGSEPASTLTKGWPELPTETTIDEDRGQALLETADEQTDWDKSDVQPRIYLEDGSPVTNHSEFQQLTDEFRQDDGTYWLVPGVVQRHQARSELGTLGVEFHCRQCGAVTGHELHGLDGFECHSHCDRLIWTCRECGQHRHEPEQEDDTDESTGYEHLPDGVSPEDIHGDEPDFQEQEFQDQIEAYRERYGLFPWER
jgi:RNase P subunit RPR2